jgi:hypothetical protein
MDDAREAPRARNRKRRKPRKRAREIPLKNLVKQVKFRGASCRSISCQGRKRGKISKMPDLSSLGQALNHLDAYTNLAKSHGGAFPMSLQPKEKLK